MACPICNRDHQIGDPCGPANDGVVILGKVDLTPLLTKWRKAGTKPSEEDRRRMEIAGLEMIEKIRRDNDSKNNT